jgi:hypothetical protein
MTIDAGAGSLYNVDMVARGFTGRPEIARRSSTMFEILKVRMPARELS